MWRKKNNYPICCKTNRFPALVQGHSGVKCISCTGSQGENMMYCPSEAFPQDENHIPWFDKTDTPDGVGQFLGMLPLEQSCPYNRAMCDRYGLHE
jgi:hypothetical protein